MNIKAVYPGTFDPVTNGHMDLITRASRIFPELVVAVACNHQKRPFFSFNERIAFVEEAVKTTQGVSVMGFDELLVRFVEAQQGCVILRGVRSAADFEYEFQLAGINRQLSKSVETLFLLPSSDALFISSTFVREIARVGGDVSLFVPNGVAMAFEQKRGLLPADALIETLDR